MSVLVERSMGELNEEQRPTMYPLFQKGSKSQPQTSTEQPQDSPFLHEAQANRAPKKKGPGRPSKRTMSAGSTSSEQPNSTVQTPDDTHDAELLEVDPNSGRRKRRKTKSPSGKLAFSNADIINQSTRDGLGSVTADFRGPQDIPIPTHDLLDLRSKLPEEIPISNGRIHGTSGQRMSTSASGKDVICIDEDDTTVRMFMPPMNGTSAQAGEFHELLHTVSSDPQQDPNVNKTIIGLAPTKPTKILHFNSKTGTIGSPPAKKIPPAAEMDKPRLKTARGRRPKTMMLTIRYGDGQNFPSSLGQKIEQILSSPLKVQPPKQEQEFAAKPKPSKSCPPRPPKPVHPLFLGKAAQKNQIPQTPTASDNNIIDLTGNQDPAAQSRARLATQQKAPSANKPSVTFSGFGSISKLVKFPGAVEPAWPWKGMVHVRGAEAIPETINTAMASFPVTSSLKKSKYQATRISGIENVIDNLAADLSIQNVVQSIQDINPDEYPAIPQCLRIPTKHYESGLDIQKRVRKLVRTHLPPPLAAPVSFSEDEVQIDGVHPALLRVYSSIATSMSAFDKGQCETQTWAHKYSPKCSAEVLQNGREADVLKNWLQALTVQSIEIGSGGKANSGLKSENAPKRKRKSKKLDDFVVATDEEDNDLDEITEPEDEVPSSNPRQEKRTVVRGRDAAAQGTKVANAVVLSGPHGCGKTAAVYAAAKELGFEVFEINAGGRRSGKDILEKVGDMARNHQVQRSSAPTEADGSSEDRERIDNALADDLKSGRQGKMDSFFKSQPAKSTPKPKAKVASATKVDSAKGVNTAKVQMVMPDIAKNGIFSKMSSKKQQQSLILIEEADILYKEDAQFWTTILNLIATSKRPIVITCNNESVIPMNDLKLHATIRMAPPPVDLAVDYLLLVAACEGHIIKRKAAKELYEGRNWDLRASLYELNFWCQFAVGDVKGGLDWYYPRWPAGNDVDEHGNVIRVLSEGTYETGMGWLSQDYLESHVHYLDIEEETLHEACNEWGVDLGDWVENIGVEKWANKLRDNSNGKRDELAALNMYADFAESMSVADLVSGGTFAPENQIALDVSIPKLSMKARDDYTLAFELKEAPALVTYNTTSKDIALYMKSRVRNILHLDQHLQHNFEVPTELDRPSEATILRLIRDQTTSPSEKLDRFDFSSAFDPIAASEKYVWSTSLEASSFDRTFTLIVEDLAPYVRSIVAYDVRLQQDRLKLSSLMSEGGKRPGKRMRTTRAAMSALEGGARVSTRRDRYFNATLNSNWVLRTGMDSWTEAALCEMESAEAPTSSRRSSKASLEGTEKEESGRDGLMGQSLTVL
ncbi:hypothetical protein ONS96_009486 [Cadophora gregata f. sp. sojae]|nr:hypothetical protein ONS96_009486 [Cadophora gregata f. sp. sojae]